MKKFTLLAALLLICSGIAKTQTTTIEDFDHIRLNVMTGGEEDNSTMIVVPDPTMEEGDPFNWVVQYNRMQNGIPWGGFWSALDEPIDITDNPYVHVRVWKPRISPLRFKIEGGPDDDLEVLSMNEQTLTEEWEYIVFDFSERSGQWNVIAFMPDFEDPLELDEDIVIYFDHIYLNNDPEPGSDPVYVIEDFDIIAINLMLSGEDDNSSIAVVPNPDPDGINESTHVAEFTRSQNGIPWGGFWSRLEEPVDLTENKFIYVDVWKPRISPLRFKVEDGETGDLEIESMSPQTLTEEWEVIVFDFSEKTGLWNVIAFMPDFQDPVDLDEDIVIYFSNIRTGPDPGLSTQEPLPVIEQPRIFPNPSAALITISHHEDLHLVEVIDLAGRSVYKKDQINASSIELNLSALGQGIFLVRVSWGTGTSTQRIQLHP